MHVDGDSPTKIHPAILKRVSKLKDENPGAHEKIDAAFKRLMDDPNADVYDVITTLDREFSSRPVKKAVPKKRGRGASPRRSRRS